MVMVNSTMLPLGSGAPDFALPDTTGQTVRRADFAGKPLLVMFICNHCPFVKHVARELKRLADEYMSRGVAVVAIMSNDAANYPDDAPEKMADEVIQRGYLFPYLYDETQEVAKAYTAACTPDLFLFNAEHKLYYRGQLDETRPKRIESGVYDFETTPAHGKDLRAALDALMLGRPAPETQYPAAGCNIKWKPGNEPDYFKT